MGASASVQPVARPHPNPSPEGEGLSLFNATSSRSRPSSRPSSVQPERSRRPRDNLRAGASAGRGLRLRSARRAGGDGIAGPCPIDAACRLRQGAPSVSGLCGRNHLSRYGNAGPSLAGAGGRTDRACPGRIRHDPGQRAGAGADRRPRPLPGERRAAAGPRPLCRRRLSPPASRRTDRRAVVGTGFVARHRHPRPDR